MLEEDPECFGFFSVGFWTRPLPKSDGRKTETWWWEKKTGEQAGPLWSIVDDDGDRAPSRAPHSFHNGPMLRRCPLALLLVKHHKDAPETLEDGTLLLGVCAFPSDLQHPAALILGIGDLETLG